MLDLHEFYQGQTRVFGHRGAKAYAPMNTMPSFELAYQQGVHGIELDVHRSKDGYPVIVHDFTVDRTTNGTGLVTAKTLAELKLLDSGSWFGESFVGVQIPTLDEVFEAFGKSLVINVEIKSTFDAENVDHTDGVEQVVADCIVRHGMENRVIVSSFNPYSLIRFQQMLADVAIGFLHEPSFGVDPLTIMAQHVYEAYHPYFRSITADMVEHEHAQGRVINTWTVNDVSDALQLKALGVDSVITDHPDVILAAFQS